MIKKRHVPDYQPLRSCEAVRDIAVSIATRYWLDGPEIESR
jgi:hypothetical protein